MSHSDSSLDAAVAAASVEGDAPSGATAAAASAKRSDELALCIARMRSAALADPDINASRAPTPSSSPVDAVAGAGATAPADDCARAIIEAKLLPPPEPTGSPVSLAVWTSRSREANASAAFQSSSALTTVRDRGAVDRAGANAREKHARPAHNASRNIAVVLASTAPTANPHEPFY